MIGVESKFKTYALSIISIIAICACFFDLSYSIFSSAGNSTAIIEVAKFEIALKDGDAPVEKAFDIPFRSVGNANIGQNRLAPGSTLRASLVLDFSGTEVSIDYYIFAVKQSVERIFGTDNITLSIRDESNNDVVLGKYICLPLINRQKLTSETGKRTVNFDLTWKATGDNSAHTTIAKNYDVVKIPVYVGVKQHIDNAENAEDGRKVTQSISYIETLKTKSRITKPLNYTFDNQDELHDNPERGFYSTSILVLTESGTTTSSVITKSNTSNLLYLKVDLSAFSGNMNSSGTDKDLTVAAITELKKVLELIKQNNNTVILRFVYDNNATEIIKNIDGTKKHKVEPAQTTIQKHIGSLSQTFKDYASTINIIQIGFYGLWGECFYNTDAPETPEHYKETVTWLLNATRGTEITIAVRTPQYYSWYRSLEKPELDALNGTNDVTTSAEEAYRVGVFNDAYGGDSTDLGTYINRSDETDWLEHQSSHTFYGGEAIPDYAADAATGVGTYNVWSYFIPEAFKLHTSYLNWEWNQVLHKAWAGQLYDGSDWLYKNISALTYIENHLGYRFVIREVRTYENSSSGEKLPIDMTISNVGFGNLIKTKQADIIITNSVGNIVATYPNVSLNAKEFLARTTVKKSISVNLPTLSAGEYNIYLRLSSGQLLSSGKYYSAIQFANDNVYNHELQANLIGKTRVI